METKQHHAQQPQSQPMQPQQQQPPHQQQNANLNPRSPAWQFGLFDCFADTEGSLVACFLPCILHGKTMDRMRDPSLQSHDPLNNECLIWGGIQCFTCCGWLYNMVKRAEMREKYGIQGSAASDCCTSYCCLCCALVQQDREVALRGAGHYAPVTQAYQGHTQGMQMPAPAQPAAPQAYQAFPPQGSRQQEQQQQQQQQQQEQQQQPMQSGIQPVHEHVQGMPAYPQKQ